MKKSVKLGLAFILGAGALGMLSDPETPEQPIYEEKIVESTPEKEWREVVLESLEQKEDIEIPDFDQEKEYVELEESSLDQTLPVQFLTIKGEGDHVGSAIVTLDQKSFEESSHVNESIVPTGFTDTTSENIDGGVFFVKSKLLPSKLSDISLEKQITITATPSFQRGMSHWESLIKDYLEKTNNHVLVRADPIYEENAALCNGIILQARSVEDDELSFKAYVYNEQPNFEINKQTSEIRDLKKEAEEAEKARLEEEQRAEEARLAEEARIAAEEAALRAQQVQSIESQVWIPRTGSKYHSNPNCSNMKNPSQVSLSQAQSWGYEPCKKCY